MYSSVENTSKTQFIISLDEDSDSDLGNDQVEGEREENNNPYSEEVEEVKENEVNNIDDAILVHAHDWESYGNQNEQLNIDKKDDEHDNVLDLNESSGLNILPIDKSQNYLLDLDCALSLANYDDDDEFCMIIDEMTDELEYIKNHGKESRKENIVINISDDDDDDDDLFVVHHSFVQREDNPTCSKSFSSLFRAPFRAPFQAQANYIPLSNASCSKRPLSSSDTNLSTSPKPSTSSCIHNSPPAKQTKLPEEYSDYRTFSELGDLIEDENPRCSTSFPHKEFDSPFDFLSLSQPSERRSEQARAASSCSVASVSSSVTSDSISYIANQVEMDKSVVSSVINLIEDECTLPFISRYRQNFINGINSDQVRKISDAYKALKVAKRKAQDVAKSLKQQNKLDVKLQNALNKCKTEYEVDQLYLLCRDVNDKATKARNYGLNDSALDILRGNPVNPARFVNEYAIGLDSIQSVNQAWESIIMDIISKDCDILEFLISKCKELEPNLEVNINPLKEAELKRSNKDLIGKYKRFDQFIKPIDQIDAHILMAIERGENIGLLMVFIEFNESIYLSLRDYCLRVKWSQTSATFLDGCIKKAWANYLKPNIATYIRYEMRHAAHQKALEVFRTNVKHLLLEPPLRGETIMGVDVGHQNGCKIAVVLPWSDPVDHVIVKIDTPINCDKAAETIHNLLLDHCCSIIAIGNGNGCRQFENFLLNLIESKYFHPLDVKYKIVSESGVSYYSVSDNARREFPNLPPNIIGAVSIARRLQDPLGELVKCDPKRLQVGMFMRDIDESMIKQTFDEVAIECVSLVGVDVNTASFALLSKVSGLDPILAQRIIEKRECDGQYTSRSQLKNIHGLGWKQFEQSAGFMKIIPSTRERNINAQTSNKQSASTSSTHDYDPLDSTTIHPESYNSTEKFLNMIGAYKQEIGKPDIRFKIETLMMRYSIEEIAQFCNTNTANMQLIIDSLQQSFDHDLRNCFDKLYLPHIQHFHDLKVDFSLRGRVVNITPFGAFIDCGIANGINALMPIKFFKDTDLTTNNIIQVKIISIDKFLKRFRVKLLEIIS